VKTGPAKQMCPLDSDWYYIRAASVARKMYLHGGSGVGVGALRTYYGGNKHCGPRPNHFRKSSGAVIKHVVKQLESVGVIDKHPDGGRRITREGTKDLDRVASKVLSGKALTLRKKLIVKKKKVVPAKVAPKVAEKKEQPKGKAAGAAKPEKKPAAAKGKGKDNAPKTQKSAGKSGGGKAKKKKWSKGKVREKVNNLVLFDSAALDRLNNEVPTYRLITPSIISERLKINGSLARRAIRHLVSKGQIREVSRSHNQKIYTRNTPGTTAPAPTPAAATAATPAKEAKQAEKE